jgi:hypothetical protein
MGWMLKAMQMRYSIDNKDKGFVGKPAKSLYPGDKAILVEVTQFRRESVV